MSVLRATRRKALLTLHLAFSAILLGVAAVFLALSLTAANTREGEVLRACYLAMHALSRTVLIGSTVGALVTGVLLSVLTHWGLFKHSWIIAKEGLTLLAIALGPVGMRYWTFRAIKLTSAEGIAAIHDPAFVVNSAQLWTGIALQILSLSAMFVLSVYKPRGQRARNNGTKIA